MMEEKRLTAPENFPFPFTPYSIQTDFMKALYKTIEEKKIGIFESPTGTGKSLSMICGALKWLQDHEERERQIKNQDPSTLSEPLKDKDELSWVTEFSAKQENKKIMKENVESLKREARRHAKLEKLRKGQIEDIFTVNNGKFSRKRKIEEVDETVRLMEQAKKELEKGFSAESVDPEELALLPDDYNSDEDLDVEETKDDFSDQTKIYFCSRTHSQLSQFVHEVLKSPYNPTSLQTPVTLDLTLSTIASRNSLCINQSVKALGNISLINEKCLDLQSGKAQSTTKAKRKKLTSTSCPYVKNVEGKTKLVGEILKRPMDVEELAKFGEKNEACPYYSARKAAGFSQLVVLPYQAILHHETRSATNISLKNSVVIIDEAHNLIEAINSMHSCQISLNHLKTAFGQLTRYQIRYSKMLAAKNIFYVKQLIYVLKNLIEVFRPISDENKDSTQNEDVVMDVLKFLSSTKLDMINWFKIVKYCKESRISTKLNGFVERHENHEGSVAINSPLKSTSKLTNFLQNIHNKGSPLEVAKDPQKREVVLRSPLQIIEALFQAFATAADDGRILITRTSVSSPKLKFLLLNPAQHFKTLIDECRSIIIAGGTMKPSSTLVDQLLAVADQDTSASRSRFVEFSCGHVVDGSKQLMPIILECGPSGQEFEFSYNKLSNLKQLDQLGMLLCNLCAVVPGGIVCFFASYKFSQTVYKRWKDSGIVSRIEKKKKIFCESQTDKQVESILSRFRKQIEDCDQQLAPGNGAILLSVVGGKMSEGINFSDQLGRCVLMVGLPYPNIKSVELQEKMKYIDTTIKQSSNQPKPSSIYYEELCMKAVNQSIGRAIRHRNDYACILLVDKRYSRSSVISKLPDWISDHLRKCKSFGPCFSGIRNFFVNKKEAKS